MARGGRNRSLQKRKRSKNLRPRTRPNTVFARTRGGITTQIGFLKYLQFIRTAISVLPTNKASGFLSLFDFGFDLIVKALGKISYYAGAFCVIGVSPAALLINSPLLADQGDEGYSFPGFPVSVTYIKFVIRNTTKLSEHSGRWAAVFIPYREVHDASHYKTALKLTFSEICSMPHAKSGASSSDITILYRMRDKTNYCSRPREITEEIGLVVVVWDSSSRDDTLMKTAFTNIDFNCEIEISGGCRPHVIFGPRHRINYDVDKFKLRSITQGDSVRVHHENGKIEHVLFSKFLKDKTDEVDGCSDFEMLKV